MDQAPPRNRLTQALARSPRRWMWCGVALLLGGAAAWSVWPSDPLAPLLAGRSFTERELVTLSVEFARQGVPWEQSGSQVLVPSSRLADGLQAAHECGVLAGDLGRRKSPSLQTSLLDTRLDRERKYRLRDQEELSQLVSSMNGIQESTVQYDELQVGGLHREIRRRALVAVRAVGGRQLTADQHEAIRRLVAGSKVGLLDEDITVTDLNFPTSFDRESPRRLDPASPASRGSIRHASQRAPQRGPGSGNAAAILLPPPEADPETSDHFLSDHAADHFPTDHSNAADPDRVAVSSLPNADGCDAQQLTAAVRAALAYVPTIEVEVEVAAPPRASAPRQAGLRRTPIDAVIQVAAGRDGAEAPVLPGQILVHLGLPAATLRSFGSLDQQRRMASHLRAQTLAVLPPSKTPGDRQVRMRTLRDGASRSFVSPRQWGAAWWGAAFGIGGGLLLLIWPLRPWRRRPLRRSEPSELEAPTSGAATLADASELSETAAAACGERSGAAAPLMASRSVEPAGDWRALGGQLSAQVLAAPRQAARVIAAWAGDAETP